jgi:hypothetical protein
MLSALAARAKQQKHHNSSIEIINKSRKSALGCDVSTTQFELQWKTWSFSSIISRFKLQLAEVMTATRATNSVGFMLDIDGKRVNLSSST